MSKTLKNTPKPIKHFKILHKSMGLSTTSKISLNNSSFFYILKPLAINLFFCCYMLIFSHFVMFFTRKSFETFLANSEGVRVWPLLNVCVVEDFTFVLQFLKISQAYCSYFRNTDLDQGLTNTSCIQASNVFLWEQLDCLKFICLSLGQSLSRSSFSAFSTFFPIWE